MDNRLRFPVRPNPLPQESAAGYLMRTFEVNGMPWSTTRLRTLGIALADLFAARPDVLEACGLDPEPFAGTALSVQSNTRVAVRGEVLHRKDWSTDVRRWCPECFKADLVDASLGGRTPRWRIHLRFWWDANCVLTCPVHSVRLAHSCPTCGVGLHWKGGNLTACSAGHSLLSCEPVRVVPEHTRADRYVLGRLGVSARVHVPLLDAFTLKDALVAMARLGAAAIAGPAGGLKNIDPVRHPEVMSTGFDIASGWPDSAPSLFERVLSMAEENPWRKGITGVYGELLRWASRTRKTSSGRSIYDAIHRHYAGLAPVRAGSETAAIAGDASLVNVTRIAEACGANTGFIVKYLHRLGIEPVNAVGKTQAYSRESADMMRRIFADSVGVEEASAMLGIHFNKVATIVQKGVLLPMPEQEKVDVRHKRLSRLGIEQFLARLADGVPVVDVVPDGLRRLTDGIATRGVGGIHSAIGMIFAGKARVRARLGGAPGLQALLIDPDEFRVAHRSNGLDLVPFKDVAAILGIHHETAAAALDKGMLEKALSDRIGTMVTRASVDLFAATYTTASHLVGERPRDRVRAQRLLKEAGVEPALSKELHPRCKTIVYRLADIPAHVAAECRIIATRS